MLAGLPHCARGTLQERASRTAARVNRTALESPGWPRDLASLERFPAEFGAWFADGLDDQVVEFQRLVLLRIVTDLHTRSDLDLAPSRLFPAED